MENSVGFDIPEGHFIHTTDTAKFIVGPDGEAVYAIENGEQVPIEKWKAGRVTGGLSVGNPEGFTGHPVHCRTHPHHQLNTFGLEAREYRIHWDAQYPTVVRNADGEAVFLLKDGRCEAIG
jgi:hypothetical protein